MRKPKFQKTINSDIGLVNQNIFHHDTNQTIGSDGQNHQNTNQSFLKQTMVINEPRDSIKSQQNPKFSRLQ